MPNPRRSRRVAAATYDSNGRDYLASQMGWSVEELTDWLASNTVRPELQMWYRFCISSKRRYNDGIDWINTGKNGYYYNPSDLEEDLLLMCLDEGHGEAADGAFSNENPPTSKWLTQELWARTAHRIVENNSGHHSPFGKALVKHLAAVYAFAIDLLCIAFHSIAFRGSDSVWESIINGAGSTPSLDEDVDMSSADDQSDSAKVQSQFFPNSVLGTYSNEDSGSASYVASSAASLPKKSHAMQLHRSQTPDTSPGTLQISAMPENVLVAQRKDIDHGTPSPTPAAELGPKRKKSDSTLIGEWLQEVQTSTNHPQALSYGHDPSGKTERIATNEVDEVSLPIRAYRRAHTSVAWRR